MSCNVRSNDTDPILFEVVGTSNAGMHKLLKATLSREVPSSFSFSSSSSPFSSFILRCSGFPSVLPVNEVSQEKWNAYWKFFSETCSDQIDSLIHRFSSAAYEAPYLSRGTDSVLSSGSNSRSVHVCIQGEMEPLFNKSTVFEGCFRPWNSDSTKSLLQTLVIFYARQCGAIELVEVGENGKDKFAMRSSVDQIRGKEEDNGRTPITTLLCSIHFTTHAAAVMFYLWLSSSMDINYLWDSFRTDLVSFLGVPKSTTAFASIEVDTPVAARETSFIQLLSSMKIPIPFPAIRFAPFLGQPTAATMTAPALLLGFNIFFPTIFVDRLFCGMIQAKEVQFLKSSKSFLITFSDVKSSRVALHILQHSLWYVFGLVLIPVDL